MGRKLKDIFIPLFVFAALLCIVEAALRLFGHAPGDLSPNWLNFKPVDSLQLDNYFYTGKDGILIADSNYWAKMDIRINRAGFRSPDFSVHDSAKRKIMFIGDSFAWGASAEPITGHCFVDLVRNETRDEVFNFGIPGADPAQYYEIAKKYVPQLKPDIIFIMFFMGNDLMIEDRKIVPGRPFCYATNAGMIFADMDGRFFPTAQAAYNYVSHEKYYLQKPDNFFEWLISKSAILSRLYSVRFRIVEKLAYEKAVKESPVTKKYLKGIGAIAAQYGIPVKFVLIPELKEADVNLAKYKERYNSLLGDSILKSDWLLVQNSGKYFVDYPNGHLNNAGHRHYADFLEGYLKELR